MNVLDIIGLAVTVIVVIVAICFGEREEQE